MPICAENATTVYVLGLRPSDGSLNSAIGIGIVIVIVLLIAGVYLYTGSSTNNAVKNSTSNEAKSINITLPQARLTAVDFGVAASYVNESDLLLAKGYGMKFMRADVAFEPSFNSFMQNATAAGISVLGILDYDTVGAEIAPGGTCVSGCNWTLSQWNESVEEAVKAYPQIHYWEIWNEPQFSTFQDGFQDGNPHNYSLMLKSAYGIIKAYNSSDSVVCMGGDNIFVYEGNATIIDYEWARALWSYNASSYCNIVSLHAYSDGALLNTTLAPNLTLETIFNNNLAAYENLTGKPIWITEVGIPSNLNYTSNGAAYQSTFLNQSFSLLLSKDYITGIFWFNLANVPFNTSQYDYGLFNGTNFDPHPAALQYKSFADGSS